MNDPRSIALSLMRRLLAGERGNVPMHLAMLLEKSSKLRNTEEHYNQIIPSELQEVDLDPATAEEIIATICEETYHRPDAVLLSVLSTTGAPVVTQFMAKLLARPPRPLREDELRQAFGVLESYLSSQLADNPGFLEPDLKKALRQTAQELSNSADFVLKRRASRILQTLR